VIPTYHRSFQETLLLAYTLYLALLRGRSLCVVLEMLNNVTPPNTYSVQGPSGGVIDWYQEPRAPTIPPSPDYTPASLDYSPASDTESDPSEDPSSGHIPPSPVVSPFLSSDDDTTNSDTPDTPPSPTHDDSARDSSSDSSSEASSDSSSRHTLSDHSSLDLPSTSARPSRMRRRSPMTYVPSLLPVSRALSHVHVNLIPSPKKVRDSGYLADVEFGLRETSLRDDVIARDNALRDRGIDARVVVEAVDRDEIKTGVRGPVEAKIVECFAYADALRDRGINARVVVEAVDRDEIKTGVRGPVEVSVERITHTAMLEDIPEPAQEGAVEGTEGVQREQGCRIVRVKLGVTALTERVAELKRDNKRLRGTASVESQRVNRL
nr:hypothetical protein [Tanacetum cinerariifolium]